MLYEIRKISKGDITIVATGGNETADIEYRIGIDVYKMEMLIYISVDGATYHQMTLDSKTDREAVRSLLSSLSDLEFKARNHLADTLKNKARLIFND